MKRNGNRKTKCIAAGMAFAFSMILAAGPQMTAEVQAEEGYYDEAGNWITEGSADVPYIGEDVTVDFGAYMDGSTAEVIEIGDSGENVSPNENAPVVDVTAEPRTGTFTVEDGWAVDSSESTKDVTVYRQSAQMDAEETSTITCSYMDTNYSVLEYEQLRDMLTNNLLYSNVNAQISTSAVYTQAKDYLYILIVDDSAQSYRDLYYYVVGDYRCFSLEVKEYRAEAEQAKAAQLLTPQEVGQKAAESFVWNAG